MKSLNIPEGQRKLIATVITMILAVVSEKYFGGLSDNLALLIGSALALFVGGNAMEYVAQIKGKTTVQQKQEVQDIEVYSEGEPEVKELSVAEVMNQLVNLDNAAGAQLKQLRDSVAGLEARMKTQAENIDKIVNIINKLTNSAGGPNGKTQQAP